MTEKKVVEKKAPEKVEEYKGNYVMIATHLAWGKNSKNHLFAKSKPEINAKTMGKYSDVLKLWFKNGWIEKGSYKK